MAAMVVASKVGKDGNVSPDHLAAMVVVSKVGKDGNVSHEDGHEYTTIAVARDQLVMVVTRNGLVG